MSKAKGGRGPGASDTTKALRHGISPAAARLNDRVEVPGPGDRWRPLPDVPGGLELVDKRGASKGYVYVPKAWAVGEGEEGG